MIGKDHQAKGYGTLALQMAIDEMTSKGLNESERCINLLIILLENFIKMNFIETGEYDECGDIILELGIFLKR